MAKIKIQRKEFEITNKDIILFNGACWQLLTQKVFKDWNECCPTISKTMCEKFVKKDILVMVKKEKEYIASNGKQMGLYYYKFDIEKLENYLKNSNENS